MAYWGPPFVDAADHARFACLAALEMIERIAALRKEIPDLLGVRGTPMETCDLRIGIATSKALVGSIGSDVMMSYTVMGNVAGTWRPAWRARTKGMAPATSPRKPPLPRQAPRSKFARSIGSWWKARPVRKSSMKSWDARANSRRSDHCLRARYQEALAAYRERRWDDALGALEAAVEVMPGDGPSMTLNRRLDGLKANPPSEDWDASWHIQK